AYIGRSKQHGKQIGKVSEDYRKATMKTLRIAFLSSFALDFFTSLSIAFVAVGLGFRLIDGAILLFPALTILLLAPEYFSPIKQVGKDYHATLDGQLAMAEIHALLKSEHPINRQEQEKGVPGNIERIQAEKLTVIIDEKQLLSNVSFRVTHGWVGIIGESGAGKTTLLQALAGYNLATSGALYMNEQTEIRSARFGWTEQIAYIPQDPYIFPLSLADNMRFYAPDCSDEKIEVMIEKLDLKELVRQLPNG